MRGGSSATTPGARSRSSAWSRRMNYSSVRGSSRTSSGGSGLSIGHDGRDAIPSTAMSGLDAPRPRDPARRGRARRPHSCSCTAAARARRTSPACSRCSTRERRFVGACPRGPLQLPPVGFHWYAVRAHRLSRTPTRSRPPTRALGDWLDALAEHTGVPPERHRPRRLLAGHRDGLGARPRPRPPAPGRASSAISGFVPTVEGFEARPRAAGRPAGGDRARDRGSGHRRSSSGAPRASSATEAGAEVLYRERPGRALHRPARGAGARRPGCRSAGRRRRCRDELPPPAADDGRRLPARRRVSKVIALVAAARLHAPPDARRLRHRRAAADDDHPGLDRRCAWASARRSCASTSSTPTPSAGARSRARRPASCSPSRRSLAGAVAIFAGPLSDSLLGSSQPGGHARDRARPVGVHEPRARLRAAAGGGARAGLRARVADQRRAHGRADGLARRRARRGRARPAGSATTSPRRSCCSACGGCCATRSASASGGSTAASSARCCASACRPCPPRSRSSRSSSSTGCGCTASRARRRPACTRCRSSSRASSCSRCARSSTRGRRWRTRSPTTPRPAASTRASRPTTCCSPGVVVAGLALLGPLAGADVRGAGVLRRARGAAVGRARLGAVRPVPRPGGDGRARAGHGAQLPGRAVRAGRRTSRCWRCSSGRSGSRAPASPWSAPTW